MRILVIGQLNALDECKDKFGSGHQYEWTPHHKEAIPVLAEADVVFDFLIGDEPTQMKTYESTIKAFIFLNTTAITLSELYYRSGIKTTNVIFGFCGAPTFLIRPLLELSVHQKETKLQLQQVCANLSTEFVLVDDRVGMVTPRIICMIINEAYYTEQEGTTTRADIDIAMKLGTNYPYGPFEWCEKIGVRNIYELLSAVYDDTKDERYKICPLLKREYFKSTQQ